MKQILVTTFNKNVNTDDIGYILSFLGMELNKFSLKYKYNKVYLYCNSDYMTNTTGLKFFLSHLIKN